MMEKSISEKIIELRKARGLTQEQLGERLGITGQAVSKWETGASLPDILILPQLCQVLGTTLDDLLDAPSDVRGKSVVADFCRYARETDRISAIEDVIARLLFNDCGNRFDGVNVAFGSKRLMLSDDRGMGFVMGETYRKVCVDLDSERVVNFLQSFSDRRMLDALKIIAMETVTAEELAERLNMELSETKLLLLELSERSLASYEVNRNGKSGYTPSANMVAFWMTLAGCVVALGGIGNFWQSS